MEKMKGTMLYGIGDIRLEEVDKPKPAPGEVLIRVRAATTCGTDVKTFVRGYPFIKEYPVPFGHGECAGDVVEVGSGVEGFGVGQRVVAHNTAPCFQCYFCKKNMFNFCQNMTHTRGSYQEYLVIPSQIVKYNMFEIPDDISYEEAAQLEPFSCAVHGNDRSNIEVGDRVVIVGSGPQGLYHLQLARLSGATEVMMVDLVDYRLDVARKLGADHTINPSRDDVERRVKELTGGIGPDVAIEAVGLPRTWEQAIRLVRNGGTVNLYAGCEAGTEIRVSTEWLHYGELTLVGTRHTTPYHVRKAFELITSRRVDVKSIVSHFLPLDNVKEAFEILTTKKDALKIAITP